MEKLPEKDVKRLAIEAGPKRHLALAELARRVRKGSSSLNGHTGGSWPGWPREPNDVEYEWALLQWSRKFNETDLGLISAQERRIAALETRLDADQASLECDLFNEIGAEMRRQTRAKATTRLTGSDTAPRPHTGKLIRHRLVARPDTEQVPKLIGT